MDSSKQLVEDKLLFCKKLKSSITKRSPMLTVAKEIANGLHEQKFNLILNVIEVLGIPIVLDLYHQTARIQENGGTMTDQGERRKSPGGVFLTLVKKSASAEQKSRIFYAENKCKSRNRKHRRRRKAIDDEKQTKTITIIQGSESNSDHIPVTEDTLLEPIVRKVETPPFPHETTNVIEEEMELDCEPSTKQNFTSDADIELARQFEEMDESHLDNFGIELS